VPVTLLFEDRIAQLTLDRPEALNALDSTMRKEWVDAWQEVRGNDEIWVVIVTGAGDRSFCVGSDLKEPPDDESSYVSRAFSGRGDGHLLPPMDTDKPILCAINGYALGGGLEIALACDIRIASANATLGLPEVRVGSMPGAGGTQNLPKSVGSSDAMYLLMTGDHVSADRALNMGLISESTSPEQLMPRTMEIASRIASNAPLSVRATKRLAKSAGDWPLARGLDAERHVWGLLRSTEDRDEGRRAFREKRPPEYRGL